MSAASCFARLHLLSATCSPIVVNSSISLFLLTGWLDLPRRQGESLTGLCTHTRVRARTHTHTHEAGIASQTCHCSLRIIKDMHCLIHLRRHRCLTCPFSRAFSLARSARLAYGINTGFGLFANVVVGPSQLAELQTNLIRSHAAGVGKPLTVEQTRMLMVLRINSLAKGHSGVRTQTLQQMVDAFNANAIAVRWPHACSKCFRSCN